MEPASRLDEYLKELHLPTIRSRYGNAAEQATQEGLLRALPARAGRARSEVRRQRIERRVRDRACRWTRTSPP